MKKIITIAAMAAFCLGAGAETVPFTYNFDNAAPKGFRKKKSKPDKDYEILEAAIFIDGTLAGKKVTSISVPVIGETEGLDDFNAFISTKLNTKSQGADRYNDPDVCKVDATLRNGVLTATFAEPYTITDKGVYVGYGLTDHTMKAKPIAVVEGSTTGASFWYRGSEANAKWTDLGTTQDLASAITVNLEGEFAPFSVSVKKFTDCHAAINEAGRAELNLINFGTKPVESVEYTASVNGTKKSYNVTFEKGVPAILSLPFTLELEIPALFALGEYEAEISIDKINGQPNASAAKSGKGNVIVHPFVPKNRPLLEEYTGLRCGYCPRGYVTLRQMHDKYGFGNFVAISYHAAFESGCMVHLSKFPYSPDGYPFAHFNRSGELNMWKTEKVWESLRSKIAPGEVEVALDWADDAKTQMKATARARFMDDNEDSPYLLSFCVVADGLSNPEWIQNNSYASDYINPDELAKCVGPYWDLFVGEGVTTDVTGLVYDDIAVQYPEKDQKGIAESLPSSVKSCEWYEATYTFNPHEIRNVKDEFVINDINKLRVIAILHDAKAGTVVNSASSLYVDGTDKVEQLIDADEEAVPVFYDLQGIRVANPTHGLYIMVKGGKAVKVML